MSGQSRSRVNARRGIGATVPVALMMVAGFVGASGDLAAAAEWLRAQWWSGWLILIVAVLLVAARIAPRPHRRGRPVEGPPDERPSSDALGVPPNHPSAPFVLSNIGSLVLEDNEVYGTNRVAVIDRIGDARISGNTLNGRAVEEGTADR